MACGMQSLPGGESLTNNRLLVWMVLPESNFLYPNKKNTFEKGIHISNDMWNSKFKLLEFKYTV